MALNATAKVNPLTCVNGRFRWTSEFDLFQLFVQDILNVKARWTVPRGQCKQVKTNNITIRWYESQSVVLEGLMVEQYRSLLQKIAAYNPNSESILSYDELDDFTPTQKPSLENINKYMVDANLTSVGLLELKETNCDSSGNLSTNEGIHETLQRRDESQLQEDRSLLQDVVKRLDLLTEQFNKHRTETSIVINELLNVWESRTIPTLNNPQENISLKESNEALKSELLECKKTITEMNAKLSIAENEIASLLTVIRVLNEERAATSSSKGKKESTLLSDAISLKNRFTGLQDENEVHVQVRDDDDICLTKVVPTESTKKTSQQQGCISKNNATSEITNTKNNRQNDGPTSKNTQESNLHNGKIAKGDSPIILIGDSIIKGINPRKISKRQIIKHTFPGKTAEEVKPEINTIPSETAPSHVIIHAGTNNLPTNSVRETVKHIEELANCVKQRFPSSQIGLSSITIRNDIDLSTKVMDVNKKIEEFCNNMGFEFIDNQNIDNSCLNGSNLHLNSKGSAYLAVNFIKFIRGKDIQSTYHPHTSKDFRFPSHQLYLLENIVKMLTPPRRSNIRAKTY
jgi:hypothetical protein